VLGDQVKFERRRKDSEKSLFLSRRLQLGFQPATRMAPQPPPMGTRRFVPISRSTWFRSGRLRILATDLLARKVTNIVRTEEIVIDHIERPSPN
jgi:hypothetical protein